MRRRCATCRMVLPLASDAAVGPVVDNTVCRHDVQSVRSGANGPVGIQPGDGSTVERPRWVVVATGGHRNSRRERSRHDCTGCARRADRRHFDGWFGAKEVGHEESSWSADTLRCHGGGAATLISGTFILWPRAEPRQAHRACPCPTHRAAAPAELPVLTTRIATADAPGRPR
jgi:hypothetical protein